MISKYNGKCRFCKEPTLAGVDHYDLAKKVSYHEACLANRDVSEGEEEKDELADKLGFE